MHSRKAELLRELGSAQRAARLTKGVGPGGVEAQQGGEGCAHNDAHVLGAHEGDEHTDASGTGHEDALGHQAQDVHTQASDADEEEHQALQEGGGKGLLEGDLGANAAGRQGEREQWGQPGSLAAARSSAGSAS